MNLEFEIEAKPSHVHVLCSGDFDLEGIKEMFRAVLATAERRHLVRAFVDARSLTGSASAVERYGVGAFISEQMLERKQAGVIRIGFVIDPERFGDTVASNRGCTVRAGTDTKEIRGWLGIEPANGPDPEAGK